MWIEMDGHASRPRAPGRYPHLNMNNTSPYDPPQVGIAREKRSRIPLRYRIKRWGIGGIGTLAIAWSFFAAYKVVHRFGFTSSWHMLLMILVVFSVGCFAMRIALRGRCGTLGTSASFRNRWKLSEETLRIIG